MAVEEAESEADTEEEERLGSLGVIGSATTAASTTTPKERAVELVRPRRVAITSRAGGPMPDRVAAADKVSASTGC